MAEDARKSKRTEEALRWMLSGGRLFVNILTKLIQALAEMGVTNDQIHALERPGGDEIIAKMAQRMAEVVKRGGEPEVADDPWPVTLQITRLVATFVAMTKLRYEYNELMGKPNDQRDVIFVHDDEHDEAELIKTQAANGYEPAVLVPFLRWWYTKGMVERKTGGAAVCIIGSPVKALPPECKNRMTCYPLFWSHATGLTDAEIKILMGGLSKGEPALYSYAFVKKAA